MSHPLSQLLERPTATAGVRTHCPYCAFQCGIVMTPQADGTVTIAPDEAFPVNRGQMCIKGFTAAELLHHPERLTTPLIRRDGRLVECTWDEALDAVAGGMRRIRDQFGPDAMAVFGSGSLTNEKAYALGKFARVVLRTANVDYNGRYCMSSAAAAQNMAFGVDRGMPFPVEDVARTDTLVLWGANCVETLPPMAQYFDRQREHGGRLIVVDPRRTATARLADVHLQLTPGSDLALANGLLYLVIELGLVDHGYVAARTSGFDAVRRVAIQYPPDRVERITGVSATLMRRTVEMLASRPAAMLLTGRGPEQQSKGVDSVLACINLMLALGKVGKPHSGYGCLTGQGNGQGGREHGQKADQLPGYRLIEDEADRAAVAKHWDVDPADLPRKGKSAREILSALGKEVRGLLVCGSNVAVASPDSTKVEQGLRELDLLVVCDSFLNETARHAHVVLPTLQWAEEAGTMTNFEGRVVLRRPAVERPAGPWSDLEIFRGLAHRIGCVRHFPSGDPEAVFTEFAQVTAGGRADYSGITYAKVTENDGVAWPCLSRDHPGTPRLFLDRFYHSDGRARFHAVHHRPAAEEPDKAYPLYFTTGRLLEHYNSGAQTRRVSSLAEAVPEPAIQVHPDLAARVGLDHGGLALVESRRGRVVFRVRVSDDIRPDTLFAPFHWGGRDAANVLTNAALDLVSRMPEFKVCAVRIRPFDQGVSP